MRFTLKQTLIAPVLFSAFLGYAITTGLGIAVGFLIFTALCWFCIARAFARWSDAGWLQRAYASATACGTTALLSIFVVGRDLPDVCARAQHTSSAMVLRCRREI